MERLEIIEKVSDVLAAEFEVEKSVMTPDANIKQALKLDSLSLVDLVALMDDTFGVKITAMDLTNIKTFNDLFDYLENKL